MNRFFSLMVGALATATIVAICTSCLTSYELKTKRIEKAKHKIDRILNKYPELRKISDTTIVSYDTIINQKYVLYNDTIITQMETIDSNLYYKLDSVYKVQQGNIEALFEFTKDNKFNYKIIKQPELIYVHDTIRFNDTIVNTRTIIKESEIIDTTKNFWFNLWLSVKGWIWWVLIIIGIIIIVRLILKYIK